MSEEFSDSDAPSRHPSSVEPARAPVHEMRCVQCDSPVYNIVCGRKSPCPTCGFPYPIGDCSDLAEN